MNALFILVLILVLIIILLIIDKVKEKYEVKQEKKECPGCVDDIRLVHFALKHYFKDFDKICRDNNIIYWADGGTLLGAVREKGIIKHDDDIDLCITEEGFDRLKQILINHPHYYLTQSNNELKVDKFKRKDIPGVWLDLFIVSSDKTNNIIKYKLKEQQDRWPKFYYKLEEVFPLINVPFEDTSITIPNKPVDYLIRGYGENWNVPVVYNRHTPD